MVVRRYIDFLILLIPSLVSALFCSSTLLFVHFFMIFVLEIYKNDFLILLIPSLVSALFCSSILLFVHFFMIFILEIYKNEKHLKRTKSRDAAAKKSRFRQEELGYISNMRKCIYLLTTIPTSHTHKFHPHPPPANHTHIFHPLPLVTPASC